MNKTILSILATTFVLSNKSTAICDFSYTTPYSGNGTSNSTSIETSVIMDDNNTVFTGTNNSLQLTLPNDTHVIDIKSNNLKLNKYEKNGNTLTSDISIQNTFSSLTFYYSRQNHKLNTESCSCGFGEFDDYNSVSYYLYNKNGKTFTSSLSIDSAIQLAGDDPLVINSPFVIIDQPQLPPPTPYIGDKVYGKLLWKDDDNHTYPLVGAKVRVKSNFIPRNSITDWVSTFTDDTGYFCIESSFSLHHDTLELVLDGKNCKVYNVDNENTNSTLGIKNHSSEYVFPLHNYEYIFKRGQSLCISSKTTNGTASTFGAAVQVFEALYYYSKYAKSLSYGNKITKCMAYYPCQKNYDENDFPKIESAYYNGKSCIMLPEKTNTDGLSVYQSWDLIGHEYGHHVGLCEKCCIGSGGYNHTFIKDNYTSVKDSFQNSQEAMNKALCLTWSEAWPTYWSEVAQASFPQRIRENYAKGYINNQKYEAANLEKVSYIPLEKTYHFDTSFERNVHAAGGENCEIAVIRFLYELNKKINSALNDEPLIKDYLWEPLLDYGNSFYYIHEEYYYDGGLKFDNIYNYFYNLILENGSYNSVTLQDLSDLASYYWFAPIQVKTTKSSNGELWIYWKMHGIPSGFENDCQASLIYYSYGVEIYRQNLNCIYESSTPRESFLKYKAKIENLISYPSSNISIGLAFSPYYYNWQCYYGYTGPYTRIIWNGTHSQLTLDNLSNINLDSKITILYEDLKHDL